MAGRSGARQNGGSGEAALGLPFAHLNLRFNPFGELLPEERGRLAVVDLGTLPTELAGTRVAVQFLGNHGRGKSTHLLALHQHFPSAAYTQLHHGDTPDFQRAHVQFIDSFDQLARRRRRAVYRVSESIAFTTHEDLSNELERFGYRCRTHVVGGHSPMLVREIVQRRIEFARRDPGAVPHVSDDDIRVLTARFGDDIRALEGHLYEVFQRLEGLGRVEV
ncbi:MAG: hypothetical protein AAF581_22405 [Planctomycetota bacterium]